MDNQFDDVFTVSDYLFESRKSNKDNYQFDDVLTVSEHLFESQRSDLQSLNSDKDDSG